jgi:hypothetical protein
MAEHREKRDTTPAAPPRAVFPDADVWLGHKPDRVTAARARARTAGKSLGLELTSDELALVALILLALEDE